jgi:hypothetical protein
MKIPSKVKIFIWRALHGIVPLKCILANRHIGTSAGCPVCNLGPEDIRHLLFQCPVAKNLWESIGINGIIEDAILDDRAGSAVLENLLKREDNNLNGMPNTGLIETTVVACWYLWWLRRRITNNESTPSLYYCKMSIFSIVANAAKATKATVVGGMTQTVKWTMPQVRYIKLNVDASFHVDRKKGATAAVLRDHQGHFVAAAGRLIPHVNSVAMAEVMAMKDGLNLANQLGCSRIEAESDSLETIEGVLVVTPGGVRVLRSLLIVWTESGV